MGVMCQPVRKTQATGQQMLERSYSWEQVRVGLRAAAVHFLIGHATLIVNPVVY